VAPVPLEYALGRFYRFNREMGERGVRGSSPVLEHRRVRAPAAVASRLGIDPGGRCLRVDRLRLGGGDPRSAASPAGILRRILAAVLLFVAVQMALNAFGVHLGR
jgi:hypothetical protein